MNDEENKKLWFFNQVSQKITIVKIKLFKDRQTNGFDETSTSPFRRGKKELKKDVAFARGKKP